ncbi:condensation domain-containing protein [Streptomyces sp. A3M-1-3]|uniref:condensation domain-containing protein n=1 Tax=Streptomyces sp. A3M-1-3 TaxID=2962044 RepID=UPI0020B63DDE|nr:condensation domain-containing protein [Streptomyces sp. A3M-1-3]MCP3820233.1 condensation domain-containing protein [Streptomyces sp. A3M-1-3]
MNADPSGQPLSSRVRHAPFTGGRGIEAGLTWSQQEIWALIENAGPHDHVYNVVEEFRVPSGVRPTEAQCLEALSFFLSRHESLRSVFPRGQGGRVVQRVLPEGRLPVEFVDTRTPGDEQVTALKEFFGTRRFSFADELPLRLVLLVTEGRVWGGVYVFSHLAIDWYGLRHLADEVTEYFRSGRTLPALAPDTQTPADLAVWQESPVGIRKRDRTLGHVASLFRDRTPLALPPAVADLPEEKAYRQAALRSRAAHHAVARIADSTGTSAAAVIVGATALVLRDLTGSDHVDLHLTSSQRFGRQSRSMVATLMQETYFSVDLADADLPQAVKRSWLSAITAFQNSGCDADSMNRLLAELGGGADAPLWFPYCVNDRRTLPADGTKPRDVPAASMLADTVLTWLPVTEEEPFYLVVDDGLDHLEFSLTCDIRHFTETGMESFLRELEGSLITLADSGL